MNGRLVSLPLWFVVFPASGLFGQEVVAADNPPVWGANPQLVEEVRIGSLMGEDEDAFGMVSALATTQGGDVWVADEQSRLIRRFSRDGTHLGDVGRMGSGPGEFRSLSGLRRLADGRMAVLDPANNRVHRFESTGELESDVQVAIGGTFGHPHPFEVDAGGAFYWLKREFPTGARMASSYYWIHVSAEGEALDTLRAPGSRVEGVHHPIRTAASISPLGYLIEGRNDRTLSGCTQRTRVRSAFNETSKQRPTTRAERSEAQALEDHYAKAREIPSRRIPNVKPLWVSFDVDRDGRLWVERYVQGSHIGETEAERDQRVDSERPKREWGQTMVFDVIEPSGRFLGTLTIPNSATASPLPRARVVEASGTELWTVERGEYDEQYVVRYRIEPGN